MYRYPARSLLTCHALVLGSLLSLPPAVSFASTSPARSVPAAPRFAERDTGRPYAAVLRFLNPRLSPSAAEQIAAAVAAESARAGLDARLVLAVLGVEGTLDQVRVGRAGFRIGGEGARPVVARMVGELAWRIQSGCDDGLPFSEAVRRTLADRAGNRCGDPPYWPRPKKYAEDVLRLYAQLSGDDPPPASVR